MKYHEKLKSKVTNEDIELALDCQILFNTNTKKNEAIVMNYLQSRKKDMIKCEKNSVAKHLYFYRLH